VVVVRPARGRDRRLASWPILRLRDGAVEPWRRGRRLARLDGLAGLRLARGAAVGERLPGPRGPVAAADPGRPTERPGRASDARGGRLIARRGPGERVT